MKGRKAVEGVRALSPRVPANTRIREDLKAAFFERKEKLRMKNVSLASLLEAAIIQFLKETENKK